jgi:hypothetical protein
MVIQAGITRVVAPEASADLVARWGADLEIAKTMFVESGVEICLIAGVR